MARKQQTSLIKKVIIVGVVLAAFQMAYLLIYRREAPLSVQDAITKSVEKMAISPERKVLLTVQLAVNDFMIKNKGQPPKDLKELVTADYFKRLPDDPATGKPFEYKVEGRKYMLGSDALSTSASGEGSAGSKAGSLEAISKEEQKVLIAMMDQEGQRERFTYDPTGKKDPFRPFDVSPDFDGGSDKTPLERYDAAQWKLSAVIDSADGPTAMLEDPNGRGFSVKKGSKIGLRDGEVIEIDSDKVLVLETEVDFTGESRTKTIQIQRKSAERPAGAAAAAGSALRRR